MAKARFYKVVPSQAVVIREQGLGNHLDGFEMAASYDEAVQLTHGALPESAQIYYGSKMTLDGLDIAKSVSKQYLVDNGYTIHPEMNQELRVQLSVDYGCYLASYVLD